MPNTTYLGCVARFNCDRKPRGTGRFFISTSNLFFLRPLRLVAPRLIVGEVRVVGGRFSPISVIL